MCALRLSLIAGYCTKEDEGSLEALLKSYKLPIKLNAELSSRDLMKAMQSDKKVLSGKIRFVILKKIGEAFLSSNFNVEQIEKVWNSVGAK